MLFWKINEKSRRNDRINRKERSNISSKSSTRCNFILTKHYRIKEESPLNQIARYKFMCSLFIFYTLCIGWLLYLRECVCVYTWRNLWGKRNSLAALLKNDIDFRDRKSFDSSSILLFQFFMVIIDNQNEDIRKTGIFPPKSHFLRKFFWSNLKMNLINFN